MKRQYIGLAIVLFCLALIAIGAVYMYILTPKTSGEEIVQGGGGWNKFLVTIRWEILPEDGTVSRQRVEDFLQSLKGLSGVIEKAVYCKNNEVVLNPNEQTASEFGKNFFSLLLKNSSERG